MSVERRSTTRFPLSDQQSARLAAYRTYPQGLYTSFSRLIDPSAQDARPATSAVRDGVDGGYGQAALSARTPAAAAFLSRVSGGDCGWVVRASATWRQGVRECGEG